MSQETNFTEVPGYFLRYIEKTHGSDMLEAMREQSGRTLAFMEQLPSDRMSYAYAPGKWTLSQVMGHVIDCERIFCYRALSFARGETSILPGFDQDSYVEQSNVGTWSLKQLLEEYTAVRNASISLFKNLDPTLLKRKGKFSGNELSVEHIGRIILGHEIHHLEVIQERYLD